MSVVRPRYRVVVEPAGIYGSRAITKRSIQKIRPIFTVVERRLIGGDLHVPGRCLSYNEKFVVRCDRRMQLALGHFKNNFQAGRSAAPCRAVSCVVCIDSAIGNLVIADFLHIGHSPLDHGAKRRFDFPQSAQLIRMASNWRTPHRKALVLRGQLWSARETQKPILIK